MNGPFVDGNKNVGHADMKALLIINGMKQIILGLATGKVVCGAVAI